MSTEATYRVTWDRPDPTILEAAAELASHEYDVRTSGQAAETREIINGTRPAWWPGWQESISHMSRNWPDTVFTVERWSQEPHNHLAAYFQDGRSYQLQVSAPPFEPDMLPDQGGARCAGAPVQYRFIDVPDDAGSEGWRRQMAHDHPITDANRLRLRREVTFICGADEPPEQVPSSGAACIHDGDDQGTHGRAVAWTWQYEIPEASGREPYDGFAGYCAPCLQESYGIQLPQVHEIFGLG